MYDEFKLHILSLTHTQNTKQFLFKCGFEITLMTTSWENSQGKVSEVIFWHLLTELLHKDLSSLIIASCIYSCGYMVSMESLLINCIYFQNCRWFLNCQSASRDNWFTGTLLHRIITAQCKGMGDVGSARYEPELLPPCLSIRVLSYSNCHRSPTPCLSEFAEISTFKS